jgi:hypothetical protein
MYLSVNASEKSEGDSPLGRTRCRYEDNNKMYLKEIGWGNEN